MSDENQSNGMDEIDDDLTENAVPNVDADAPVSTEAFAQATEQAATQALKPEPVDEADDFGFQFKYDANEHVTMANPMTQRQKLDPSKPSLAALKVDIDDLEQILKQRGLIDIDDKKLEKLSKEDRRLVNLSRSLSLIWQDLYFDGIDKQGNWNQAAMHGETRLGIGKYKLENMSDPIAAIRASFGQGTVVQVPLWNTGLWMALRAPTIQELLDFEQRTRMEKMNLGRSTNGMVFSNIEVYTVETYMRFALEHVVSVNYVFQTTDTVQELMDVIRNRDYHQIILGLISAMYPEGYPFLQPCVANPNECDHVDELLLNFARMGFVDRDKLTDKQTRMMASRKTKRDREWLLEYQKDFTFFEERISFGKGLTAVLGVPSLSEQIAAGHMWVDGIAKATNEAFGARLSEMERARHIMRSGAITGLRQHSHWIKHFEYATDPDSQPQIIDDLENKDRLLEVCSEDPDMALEASRKIIEWIQKTTVSYTALDKSPCPKCQKEAADTTHPHLIPIDIGYVFFTLAALKISLVEGAAV